MSSTYAHVSVSNHETAKSPNEHVTGQKNTQSDCFKVREHVNLNIEYLVSMWDVILVIASI